MKYNCHLHPQRTLTLQLEDFPDSVNVPSVIERFAKHCHHTGAYSDQPLLKSDEPPETGKITHIVRNVELRDDGNLDITFEFTHTLCGHYLMMDYCDGMKLKIVPVLTESGININRFDLKREV